MGSGVICVGERADRLREDLQVNALHGPARALADEAVLIVGRSEALEALLLKPSTAGCPSACPTLPLSWAEPDSETSA